MLDNRPDIQHTCASLARDIATRFIEVSLQSGDGGCIQSGFWIHQDNRALSLRRVRPLNTRRPRLIKAKRNSKLWYSFSTLSHNFHQQHANEVRQARGDAPDKQRGDSGSPT